MASTVMGGNDRLRNGKLHRRKRRGRLSIDGDMAAMHRGHSQTLNRSQLSHLDWDVGNTMGRSAS